MKEWWGKIEDFFIGPFKKILKKDQKKNKENEIYLSYTWAGFKNLCKACASFITESLTGFVRILGFKEVADEVREKIYNLCGADELSNANGFANWVRSIITIAVMTFDTFVLFPIADCVIGCKEKDNENINDNNNNPNARNIDNNIENGIDNNVNNNQCNNENEINSNNNNNFNNNNNNMFLNQPSFNNNNVNNIDNNINYECDNENKNINNNNNNQNLNDYNNNNNNKQNSTLV